MIIPRYYQTEAIDAVYNYFMSHSGNPLIGMPTASGKSILPAIFFQKVMRQWPNQRFLLMSHVGEILKQNISKILEVWPEAPMGVYSAQLKRKDTANNIICGSIQSMARNPQIFGHRDMIWIDEAHLVSQEENSQYLSFLAIMKLINPFVKIVGMSATLYRMGQGLLTDNGLFTDTCYDLTSMEGFNKLLSEGYLCQLIPFKTNTQLDVSDVSIQKGEFVATQLQGAVDKAPITFKALQELVHAGKDRRSWLIFASGIEHAEHIAEQLGAFGIDCAPVHSKRSQEYNDSALQAFKNYDLRSVVSFSKITTGFDHPGVDLIGDLRPTISIPLHVQKYGRGMRPLYAEGYNLDSIGGRLEAIKNGPKPNCIVLDFSRNTPRLGAVNDPKIPNKKGNKDGEIPIKICEMCGAYNHISARICCSCSEQFSFAVKIVSKAGTDELIRNAATEPTPIVETFNVLNATYVKWEGKNGKPPTLKATYYTTGLAFTEYVCLEHSGMAGKIGRDWWRRRHREEPPATIDAALLKISELRCPRFLRVHVNKQHPEILGAEF